MDELENIKPDEKEKPPIWMVSFADVTALTLTFFVLLFSMSTFKINEFIAVTSSLSVTNTPSSNINPLPTSDRAIDQKKEIQALPIDYVYQLLSSKIKTAKYNDVAFIEKKEHVIVLTLSDKTLFESGSFNLSRNAQQLIFGLVPILNSFGNQIDVIGHVSPKPDDQAENRTVWDVSLLRALTVSRALTNGGYNKKLSILGNADGFFNDLDPSLSLAQKQTLGKRVDIIIRSSASGQ
jgi:chemotaxis protein MotB